MSIAVLEKEMKMLPEESFHEVMDFINYLKFKYSSTSHKETEKKIDVSKRFGAFPELQKIPNDIDFCNDEIAEIFGV